MWWKVCAALAVIGAIVLIAVPLATIRIKVDLPAAIPAAPVCKSITIQMTPTRAGEQLALNGAPTTADKLLLELAKVRNCDAASTPIVIRADASIRYGDFTALTNELKMGGYTNLGLAVVGASRDRR